MKYHRCQIGLSLAALMCAACVTFAQGTAPAAAPAASSSPRPAPQTTEQGSSSKVADQTPNPNPSSSTTTPPASDDRRLFLADERQESAASAPSAAGLLARTLGALLLIIGLIVAAAWALKRMGGARFGSPRGDAPELTVLATVALGERRSVAAVRFGQRTFLLGSTAQGITLLATEERAPASSSTPTPRSVADLLQASEERAQAIFPVEPPFDQELSSAERRFAYVREAERENGGQA